jgi:hypothetical protein
MNYPRKRIGLEGNRKSYIMELVTGGVICTKALEVVTRKQEQISTSQKLDERIEASTKEILEEEGLDETTTNGVF